MPLKTPPRRRRPRDPNGLDARVFEVLRPPRALTVSEWAERNRTLSPQEAAEPGRWRNARAPYLAGLMDAFSDPEVETVVACFCAQAGKTEALLNFLGYVVDQDPGPVLIVYPSERDADKTVRNRIHPMLQGSEALRRHVVEADLGLKEIHTDNCTMYTAWANSPAALASTPCRYVILDEVDKYPAFAGREASPIKLAAVRTRTYRGRRKIGIVSTPTLEYAAIWQALQGSDRRTFWVPCPLCGEFQVLDFFKGLKYEKGAPPAQILARKLAWYECAACEGRIVDSHKATMLARGVWVPNGCRAAPDGEIIGELPSPRVAGFHLSALYSPWATWPEVAAEWLDSQGDRGRLMNFVNSWLGLPFKEKVESIDEKKIRARLKPYEQGEIPVGGKVLTCGADVQEDVIYFVIRAWGDGERSWLVRYGTVNSWDELQRAIQGRYLHKGTGTHLTVSKALIDSGFRTEEVYAFTRRLRPVTWPTKGSDNPSITTSIRLGRPAQGVLLYTLAVDFWKDRLARHIATPDAEPGAWSLPSRVEEEYVRQMTAERRVLVRKKGRLRSHWEPASEHAANHLWDCEVLNVVAAEMLGVRFLADEGAAGPAAPVPRAPGPPLEHWLTGEKLLSDGDTW